MNIEEIKEWRKTAPAVPDYGELEIIDILLEEVKRLENQFAHKQEQRDQLAHQVLELEEQNERDRCHGRDFIRLWKEGKERIAELEQDRYGWIRNFEMQEKVVSIAQQRVDELEQKLSDEKKAAGFWMELSCKDHNRAEKAEQRITQYQSKYNNLLAVAHRDGGRYLAEYGEEKAGEDAITAILTAYHNNDRYQGAVEVEDCLVANNGYGNCPLKVRGEVGGYGSSWTAPCPICGTVNRLSAPGMVKCRDCKEEYEILFT